MATTQPQSESRFGIRPSYFALGIDGAGRDHIYCPKTDTVHVIDGTERVHVERFDGDRAAPVDDWMAFVEHRAGWTRRWMLGLAALAERAVDGPEVA